jgi:hypothetical protein
VIEPGHHTGVRLSIDTAVLQVDAAGQSYAWVTAELVDAYNNVTANLADPITIDLTAVNSRDPASGYFTIDGEYTSYKTNVRTVTIPNGKSASTPMKVFPGSAGTFTIRADSRDGLSSKSVTVNVTTPGTLAMLDAPKQRLIAGPGVRTMWVVITAQDNSKRRLTGSDGKIHVAALSPVEATIVGYYDAVGAWFDVNATAADIPMDRGQIRVLVTAPAGSLSVFEAYDVQTPTVKAPLIYVQF